MNMLQKASYGVNNFGACYFRLAVLRAYLSNSVRECAANAVLQGW